jgi:hypothetical protein
MPEGQNVEIAHKLTEHEHSDRAKKRWEEIVEILEVCVLAIVAVATAYSGFQAAKWDGRQSFLYANASKERFEADAASTLGGQQLVADSSMLTAWLQAEDSGDKTLQDQLVRRFTPDYRAAFDDWLKTDPLTDHNAPPGPGYMPSFHNPNLDQAAHLNEEASANFTEGTEARETADKYVRDTVLFASVLFLVAIAQRFRIRGVRFGANGLAAAVLVYTLLEVSILPRI